MVMSLELMALILGLGSFYDSWVLCYVALGYFGYFFCGLLLLLLPLMNLTRYLSYSSFANVLILLIIVSVNYCHFYKLLQYPGLLFYRIGRRVWFTKSITIVEMVVRDIDMKGSGGYIKVIMYGWVI